VRPMVGVLFPDKHLCARLSGYKSQRFSHGDHELGRRAYFLGLEAQDSDNRRR
jgi:hypothetical protein